ncbi:hypothetical protein BaRGS_00020904 [Batillaria attramentaria]|uniref:Uncharacterized protein n=1 Tax=Batillaria attramentaria TaxID=370345 RepID=A0ABD0KLK0_9CAEN
MIEVCFDKVGILSHTATNSSHRQLTPACSHLKEGSFASENKFRESYGQATYIDTLSLRSCAAVVRLDSITIMFHTHTGNSKGRQRPCVEAETKRISGRPAEPKRTTTCLQRIRKHGTFVAPFLSR